MKTDRAAGKISETQFMAMAELTDSAGTKATPSALGRYSKPTVRRLRERGLIEESPDSGEVRTWAEAHRPRRSSVRYVLTHAGRIALHEHRQGLR